MPSWLVDDASVLYVLLGIVALGLAAGWWFTRQRSYLIGLGVVVLLLVGVWLLGRLIETDAKQIKGKLEAMAAGVEARNPDQIFTHISKDFLYRGRVTKDAFRQKHESDIRNGEVQKIKIWDVDVRNVDRTQRTATVFFKTKAEGMVVRDYQFFNCRATFVLDPDDQWRLKDFQLFPPTTDPGQGEALDLAL
jgi:hypothetical protein